MRKRFVSIVIGLMIILTITSIAKPEWFSKLQLSPQVDTPLPSGITVYAYGANGLVSKQKGTEVSYYHNDNLGSSAITTDDSGEVVYSTDYYPFGKAIHENGKEKYTYNGKELDNTGLYYYGARYYDASLGRFISVDPVSGNIYNGQRLNRYSYTLNNPLKYVDPTGNEEEIYIHYTNRRDAKSVARAMSSGGAPTPRRGKSFWVTIDLLDETDPGAIRSMLGIDSAEYRVVFSTDQRPDIIGRTRGTSTAPEFGWSSPQEGRFKLIALEKTSVALRSAARRAGGVFIGYGIYSSLANVKDAYASEGTGAAAEHGAIETGGHIGGFFGGAGAGLLVGSRTSSPWTIAGCTIVGGCIGGIVGEEAVKAYLNEYLSGESNVDVYDPNFFYETGQLEDKDEIPFAIAVPD